MGITSSATQQSVLAMTKKRKMTPGQLAYQVALATCLSSCDQFSHAAAQTSVADVFNNAHLREHCLEFLLHGIFMLCGVCKVFNAHIVCWLGSRYHELSKHSKKAVYAYLGCCGDVSTIQWVAHLHSKMKDRNMLKALGFVLTAAVRNKNEDVILWCVLNLHAFQVPMNAAMCAYSTGLRWAGDEIVTKFTNTRLVTAIRAIKRDNLELLKYCINIMTDDGRVYLSNINYGRFETMAIDCSRDDILDFLDEVYDRICLYSEEYEESSSSDSDCWMDSDDDGDVVGPILRGPCAT